MNDEVSNLTNDINSNTTNNEPIIKPYQKLLPWVAGAGFALSHIVIESSCTLPKEGRCASCGGCVVALGAIVTWAIYKKRDGRVFYQKNSTAL